ncbi:hypothetical protein [Paenibacillus sp. YAF4_2]|uniref:hypothetical protein n=1 Tax=Paenibacillus sp. YAF4_2 TaxID=3233085 RepID=UPI003F9B0E86
MGGWHNVYSEGLLFAVSFIMMAVSLSVIVGELLRDSGGNNLVIASVFHALINLGLLLLFNEESGNSSAMAIISIASLAAALAVIAISMKQRREILKLSKNLLQL